MWIGHIRQMAACQVYKKLSFLHSFWPTLNLPIRCLATADGHYISDVGSPWFIKHARLKKIVKEMNKMNMINAQIGLVNIVRDLQKGSDFKSRACERVEADIVGWFFKVVHYP